MADSVSLLLQELNGISNTKKFGESEDFFEYITGKRSLAKISGWKRKSEWVKAREPRKMKKGEVLYLEVHSKNGGGAGHVKLGVVLPGGEVLAPIPSYFFSKQCLEKAIPAASLP